MDGEYDTELLLVAGGLGVVWLTVPLVVAPEF